MKWEYEKAWMRGAKFSFAEFGSLGWELVSVDDGFAYFKRPLIEKVEKPIEKPAENKAREIRVGDWATGKDFKVQSNGRYNAYKICRIKGDSVYFFYNGEEWTRPWSLKSGEIMRVLTKSKKHNFLK